MTQDDNGVVRVKAEDSKQSGFTFSHINHRRKKPQNSFIVLQMDDLSRKMTSGFVPCVRIQVRLCPYCTQVTFLCSSAFFLK